MHERKFSFQPVALALTAIAALLRLAPHPPNFTPIGGIALFGGARLKGWQAYVIPLFAMMVTDPILSHLAGYPAYSRATIFIYASFMIYVLLGRTLISESTSPVRIASVSVLGSLQFFLITNLFVWWADTSMYLHTFGGLASCYVAALPFYGRTLAADLLYTGVLFGAYALLGHKLENGASAHIAS